MKGKTTMTNFIKNPANPIYGGPSTGTLFDVLVTRDGGRYRMDFSWRPKKALAVAFSDDGFHWSEPEITLPCDPTNGWRTTATELRHKGRRRVEDVVHRAGARLQLHRRRGEP